MAELSMTFDNSSFLAGVTVMQSKLIPAKIKALGMIGDELLRLSQLEVPFLTGELMNSGVSQEDHEGGWIVGYNKVYAAYMHEGDFPDGSHQIQNYSNNRKGKYLEDPMKVNTEIFQGFFADTIKAELGLE